MIFDVIITETRSRVIQIEAQSEEEAIAQMVEKYLKGEIVLDNEDYFEDAKYTVAS